MSRWTVTALVLLLAGLGGFYYYDTYWLVPAREKKESVKGRLWDLEPKDVESLTIKRKGETVRLKRADTGWELLEPVKTRADRGAVDGIVTSLATARVDREVAPSPASLDEFGLKAPEAEVVVEVKGRAPLGLLVGGKSPTGAWIFAKESAKPAVVALSEILARDLAKPVADLRDRTVLAFDRKSVSQVDLVLSGRHHLARESRGRQVADRQAAGARRRRRPRRGFPREARPGQGQGVRGRRAEVARRLWPRASRHRHPLGGQGQGTRRPHASSSGARTRTRRGCT